MASCRDLVGQQKIPVVTLLYGGWTVPYFDEFLGNVMTEQMGQPI